MCDYFFFNDTATTEIYTLSLHDALPISRQPRDLRRRGQAQRVPRRRSDRRRPSGLRDLPRPAKRRSPDGRSEEHTSELQSHSDLVCRLLLRTRKNHAYLLTDDYHEAYLG